MVNCVLKYVVFCCCCCCFVIEEISSVVLYLISHNYSIFLLGTLEGKENRKGYREIQVEIVSCLTLCDPMDCSTDRSVGKESTCNVGDPSSIPGSETSAGEEMGYPLQYSWASPLAQLLKNPPAT